MFATRHKSSVPLFRRVVLLGSLGGLEAFTTVLAGLPRAFSVPIVIVQHRPHAAGDRDLLAAILARRTRLPIKLAEAGHYADSPGVTVLPGATTATIGPTGRWVLTENSPAQWPGDALLISSAQTGLTIAVILSGLLDDGAEGCRAVKRLGGRVLVQDPAVARASSMPAHAIATGCADFVLPLDGLSTALLALTTAPGAADLLAVPPPPWARLTSEHPRYRAVPTPHSPMT